MVFGLQKLQNDLFCVTEERNFFESKYLAQTNEIEALKEQLKNSKRDVSRLRDELMTREEHENDGRMSPLTLDETLDEEDDEEELQERPSLFEGDVDNASLNSIGEDNDAEEEEEENDEEEDIRKSAAKLLQWADYRSERQCLNNSRLEETSTLPSTPSSGQLSDASLSESGDQDDLLSPNNMIDDIPKSLSDAKDNEQEQDCLGQVEVY
jgi:hypothetical protein